MIEHELSEPRLEALRADYVELFGARPDDFAEPGEVAVWTEPEDHERASRLWCDYERDGPTHKRGAVLRVSLRVGEKGLKEEIEVFHALHHQVAHGLLNMHSPPLWLAAHGAGWADAGVAHLLDARRLQRVGSFCYDVSFRVGKHEPDEWRAGARKLLAEGKAPPLADLVAKNTIDLSLEEHMLSFALAEHLATTDASSFALLLANLRSRTRSADAFVSVYGRKVAEVESTWRDWVLETYARR